MTLLLVQFHERFRGSVWVNYRVSHNDTADGIARRIVAHGAGLLNSRWPGLLPGEMSVVGITDGRRTLDRNGAQTFPTISAEPSGSSVKSGRFAVAR